jgi:chromosome segregation ATPase
MATNNDSNAEVHLHFDSHGFPGNILQEILNELHDLGVKMTALSDAVDAVLASEADEDAQAAAALAAKDVVIADLQAQLADLGTQLTTAMSNDASDAQAIADAQAALDAQAADTQAQIDRLAEAFPPVHTEEG